MSNPANLTARYIHQAIGLRVRGAVVGVAFSSVRGTVAWTLSFAGLTVRCRAAGGMVEGMVSQVMDLEQHVEDCRAMSEV